MNFKFVFTQNYADLSFQRRKDPELGEVVAIREEPKGLLFQIPLADFRRMAELIVGATDA